VGLGCCSEHRDLVRRDLPPVRIDQGNIFGSSRGRSRADPSERPNQGAIALIISDVVLPEMSGHSAVSKLQSVHPEMQVLYVSGYAGVPVAQQLLAGGATLLQKPVSRLDLLREVSQMLHLRIPEV
jgi:FixJ family two-component response regulator